MKRFVLCLALLTCQQTLADDDLKFATPAVTETSPACEVNGSTTTRFAHSRFAHHRGRRPIASWFQEHRPVRRLLRGAVRLVGLRCCH